MHHVIRTAVIMRLCHLRYVRILMLALLTFVIMRHIYRSHYTPYESVSGIIILVNFYAFFPTFFFEREVCDM